METFIYLCLLLFIVSFTLYIISLDLRYSPKKIKTFYLIVLIPLILKILVLLMNTVIEQQKIIYLLRHFIFLDFVTIPLLILTTLYIFLRDEKIKFNINYIFLILIALGYVVLMILQPLDIIINKQFGFVVIFQNNLISSLIYLIIIASLVVYTLLFVDKPYCNSLGMKVLLVSEIVIITEFILNLGGIKFIPYPIISNIAILIPVLMAIRTFKK